MQFLSFRLLIKLITIKYEQCFVQSDFGTVKILHSQFDFLQNLLFGRRECLQNLEDIWKNNLTGKKIEKITFNQSTYLLYVLLRLAAFLHGFDNAFQALGLLDQPFVHRFVVGRAGDGVVERFVAYFLEHVDYLKGNLGLFI
jgi:hypothetical protein